MSNIQLIYNNVPGSLGGPVYIEFYYTLTISSGSVNFFAPSVFGPGGPYNRTVSLTAGTNQFFQYDLTTPGLPGSTNWPASTVSSLTVNIIPGGTLTEFGDQSGTNPTPQNYNTLNQVQINLATLTSLKNAFKNSTVTNVSLSSNTNTQTVSNFEGTFSGCNNFNQDIGSWDITSATNMTDMLNLSGIDSTNFDSILNGWAAQAVQTSVPLGAQGLTYTNTGLPGATFLVNTKGWTIIASGPPIPCFGEDTKILCLKNGKEEYQPITSLRKGDLVKTAKDGYLKIDIIGKSKIYNFGSERIADRLYILTKKNYPELTEDLILTGYHSILVNSLTSKQREETIKLMKQIYVTGNKYRLIACLDDKAEPYIKDGFFDVYHFALENNDYFSNYGIYANGLLVETCSKRYMKELSGMTEIL